MFTLKNLARKGLRPSCCNLMNLSLNQNGADARIFWEDSVRTMANDALAHRNTKSKADTVLSLKGKHVLVFHEKGFQLPVPSECCEMIQNTNMYSCPLKTIHHVINGLHQYTAVDSRS